MAAGTVSRRMLAAAIIIQRLKKGRGKADTKQLLAALHIHRFQDRYLREGVRTIRDLYGENALVVEHPGFGASPVYVLDPKKVEQVQKWAKKMFRRALTETGHVLHVLEWSIQNGVAATSARRAKHYAENVQVELENVLASL